jgi:hypothetical protein
VTENKSVKKSISRHRKKIEELLYRYGGYNAGEEKLDLSIGLLERRARAKVRKAERKLRATRWAKELL